MITINSVIGNIYRDQNLMKRYDEMQARSLGESIRISRTEAQRVRMRKTSTRGTDIALTLPAGTKLRHGDVLVMEPGKMVSIEIEPENVAVVEIKENMHKDDVMEVPVRIGHAIGNLHRPIKLSGSRIYFPIQADSEIDMFRKMFGHLMEHATISGTKMVFEPDEGMDVHEH